MENFIDSTNSLVSECILHSAEHEHYLPEEIKRARETNIFDFVHDNFWDQAEKISDAYVTFTIGNSSLVFNNMHYGAFLNGEDDKKKQMHSVDALIALTGCSFPDAITTILAIPQDDDDISVPKGKKLQLPERYQGKEKHIAAFSMEYNKFPQKHTSWLLKHNKMYQSVKGPYYNAVYPNSDSTFFFAEGVQEADRYEYCEGAREGNFFDISTVPEGEEPELVYFCSKVKEAISLFILHNEDPNEPSEQAIYIGCGACDYPKKQGYLERAFQHAKEVYGAENIVIALPHSDYARKFYQKHKAECKGRILPNKTWHEDLIDADLVTSQALRAKEAREKKTNEINRRVERARELQAEGLSLTKIAKRLVEEGFEAEGLSKGNLSQLLTGYIRKDRPRKGSTIEPQKTVEKTEFSIVQTQHSSEPDWEVMDMSGYVAEHGKGWRVYYYQDHPEKIPEMSALDQLIMSDHDTVYEKYADCNFDVPKGVKVNTKEWMEFLSKEEQRVRDIHEYMEDLLCNANGNFYDKGAVDNLIEMCKNGEFTGSNGNPFVAIRFFPYCLTMAGIDYHVYCANKSKTNFASKSIGFSGKDADILYSAAQMFSIIMREQLQGHEYCNTDAFDEVAEKDAVLYLESYIMENPQYQQSIKKNAGLSHFAFDEYCYQFRLDTPIRIKGKITTRKTVEVSTFILSKLRNISENYSKSFRNTPYASLSPEQNRFLRLVSQKGVVFLAGKGGTGKTHTLTMLLDTYIRHNRNAAVALLTPTGKAVGVVYLKAKDNDVPIANVKFETMDRYTYELRHSNEAPKEIDLLIVDEASMLNVNTLYHFLQSVKKVKQIVFCGDIGQLKSVQAGNLYDDLSAIFPHQELVKNHRSDDGITENACKIRHGDSDIVENDHFHMIEMGGIKEFLKQFSNVDTETTMMLTPYVKSAYELNHKICGHDGGYQKGDKVIFTRNNKKLDYYNGNLGTIIGCDDGLDIMMEDDTILKLPYCYRRDIDYGYALTVHKAQGSEYDHVVIFVPKGSSKYFKRDWLYTAVTRAKNDVVLCGDLAEIKQMIETEPEKRRTILSLFTAPAKNNYRVASYCNGKVL